MEQHEQVVDRFMISYAHDDDQHVAAVRRFAGLLREHGLDVAVDADVEGDRVDWAMWAEREAGSARRVLVVPSPAYRERFDDTAPPGEGRGVRCEAQLIREVMYRDGSAALRRFVPVLLPGRTIEDIPLRLQPYTATHYRVTELTADGVLPIVRVLRRDPQADVDGPAPVPIAGSTTAVFRLDARADTPAVLDAATRAFLDAGRGTVEIDDPVADGGTGRSVVVAGSPDDAVRSLGRISRHLCALVPASEPGRIRLTVAADVAGLSDAALATTRDLVGVDAARRLHVCRQVGLVLVASSSMFRLTEADRAAFPTAVSYRAVPSGESANDVDVRIAVPGRTVCPEIPADAPPDDPGHDEAGSGDAGDAPSSGGPATTIRNVSGVVVWAGRDARVELGGLP